jgi:prevent-host-death family protein
MKAVGIRELKNQLSRFVAEVARGEVVLVTDRGRVVAELRPPASSAMVGAPPGLRRMVERGELVLGSAHDAALYRPMRACAPPGTARRLLDEERGPA